MSHPLITAVDRRGPAGRAGVRAGMRLAAVNGHAVGDVLDYLFRAYDPELRLTVIDGRGRKRTVRLAHEVGGDLGLTFDSGLMDEPRHCRNKCVFCFVDQNPPGLRQALYFKDDDLRLSFLTGNYVTLTNLSGDDERRIIEQRVSPLRVSVHAADPALRGVLLGIPGGADVMGALGRFTRAGIIVHAQIVVCPGLNDGEPLTHTLGALHALGPAMESVSVVPAGLTRHRDGLYPLKPFTPDAARGCVSRAAAFERAACADELFILAGLPLPQASCYRGYPQLENGVGMARLFLDEFAAVSAGRGHPFSQDVSVATGVSFAPFLRELAPGIKVYPVRNDFWGETVTVAGLVVGADLIGQLKGKNLGKRLLIPANMLRHQHPGDLFLDGLTPGDVSRELGVEVKAVAPDGAVFYEELCHV